MPSSSCDTNSALNRLATLGNHELAQRVADLDERLRSGDLRVLLAGEAKRGKSTLGNALVGHAVLPTGVTPVTALTTFVRQGEPARVEVDFANGGTLTTSASRIEDFVTQAHNADNQKNVTAVTVFVPEGMPHPRMVLVDTPGIGSVFEHNSDQANAALDSMDLAIFVLTADAPLSRTEAELLERVGALSVEVLLVLNKADLLNEADRRQSEEFVRASVTSAIGRPLTLFVCSGRQALAAAIARDQPAWRASGVADLHGAILDHLRESRRSLLERSIASAAARLTRQQCDQVAVTIATLRGLQEARERDLADFDQSLREVDRLRTEALDRVTTELTRQGARLSEDAARQVRPITSRVQAELEEFLAGLDAIPTEELERSGRTALAAATWAELEEWRTSWHKRQADAFAQQRLRAQELLEQITSDLIQSAEDRLGVHLTATVPDLGSSALSRLQYDFTEEVGWNGAAVSILRRARPGSRKRVTHFLRSECSRLVDRHLGRARSDLQHRMEETARALQSALSDGFDTLTHGLTEAGQSAHSIYEDGRGAVVPALTRLHNEETELNELRAYFESVAEPERDF